MVNMVNLCTTCHRAIHRDEELAAQTGWIVLGRDPGKAPIDGYRGWLLLDAEGGALLLDWASGHTSAARLPGTRPRRNPRRRESVGKRFARLA